MLCLAVIAQAFTNYACEKLGIKEEQEFQSKM